MNSRRTQPFITRLHLFSLAFFAVLFFLVYQTARLAAPFSAAFLWAAVLALALHPLYRKLTKALNGRAGLAAGMMTVATALVVIVPSIALLTVVTGQAVTLYQTALEMAHSGRLADVWSNVAHPVLEKIFLLPFLSELDVKGILIKSLGEFSTGMASQVGSILKNTLLLAVDLLIMIVSLFFFFRSGETYYRWVMDLLPFTPDQKRSVARKLHDTFVAVIMGVFLIALFQGVMTGIGFALFGVPFSVLWGGLAAVLALLPIGGAALVWLPGAVYLYLTGAKLSGVLLAAWGTVLVSLPDNFLKPLIIGRKANIPSFFLFVGILGGLEVYGFLGILFGPLTVALLAAFIEIYREEYAEE